MDGDSDEPGIEMPGEEFEELVSDALDLIPEQLARLVDNCIVLVEDWPTAPEPPDTLGLYLGTPLTERSVAYPELPDQILIFRHPILAICRSREEVVEQVRITVLHEIAHYFGIDDARLHELGYE